MGRWCMWCHVLLSFGGGALIWPDAVDCLDRNSSVSQQNVSQNKSTTPADSAGDMLLEVLKEVCPSSGQLPLSISFPRHSDIDSAGKGFLKAGVQKARALANCGWRLAASVDPASKTSTNQKAQGAFHKLFGKAYEDQAGTQEELQEAFERAERILNDGIAIMGADRSEARCKCRQSRGVYADVDPERCPDKQRMAAFVTSEDGEPIEDDGRPVVNICAWILRTADLWKLATVLLHEVLHLADPEINDQPLETASDIAYGLEKCKELADMRGGMPLRNADSYISFLEMVLGMRIGEKQGSAAPEGKTQKRKKLSDNDLGEILRRMAHSRTLFDL